MKEHKPDAWYPYPQVSTERTRGDPETSLPASTSQGVLPEAPAADLCANHITALHEHGAPECQTCTAAQHNVQHDAGETSDKTTYLNPAFKMLSIYPGTQ